MIALGIESSCDETAVGIVRDGYELLSNVVASSMDIQAKYGGVVPEIAARSHIEAIIPTVEQALKDAALTWDDIDVVAVTQGAGLSGSLLIGNLAARMLALLKRKPLYAVNHVEAHLYVNFITASRVKEIAPRTQQPTFPMLAIIVSGGHSQLVYYKNHFDYALLGQTQDDAMGEAYDKVAKILGLPYPGGAAVSRLAHEGDPKVYRMPKARMSGKYDFSYSGLKTAVLRCAQKTVGKDHTLPSIELPHMLSYQQKADLAAGFALAACESITDKVVLALEEYQPKSVVIGGGVAADRELRRQLNERLPLKIEYPSLKLCTDNGAMVAASGCFKAIHHQEQADPYTLHIEPSLSM